MPDHVHVHFEPGIKSDDANGRPEFWSLGELIGSIKSFAAHEINKREQSKGSISSRFAALDCHRASA